MVGIAPMTHVEWIGVSIGQTLLDALVASGSPS
jgi:hypothetical protein